MGLRLSACCIKKMADEERTPILTLAQARDIPSLQELQDRVLRHLEMTTIIMRQQRETLRRISNLLVMRGQVRGELEQLEEDVLNNNTPPNYHEQRFHLQERLENGDQIIRGAVREMVMEQLPAMDDILRV